MPPKRSAAATVVGDAPVKPNKRPKTAHPPPAQGSETNARNDTTNGQSGAEDVNVTGKPVPTTKVAGKRRTKKTPPSRSSTPVTFEELEACATELVQASGKSDNTLKTYRRLVKECKAYLKTFRKKESKKEKKRRTRKMNEKKPEHEAHNAPNKDPSDSPENPTTMDPDFPNALDGPPKACTPLAITLFIYHKCGPGGRGRSLADQIHAAIAWNYDELDGDKYRNWWAWDSSGQCWIGNPARSARVKSMLATIKKEHAQDPRNHSRATSFSDMQAMYKTRTARLKELEKLDDVKSQCERAELILFGALSCLAWIVWLRCGEIINLRYGDLDLSPPDRLRSDGSLFDYIIVSVCKRKNWTVKDETDLTGHIYHLYKRVDQPSIDAYTSIKDWIAAYTTILGRPLRDEDVLFPTLNASARADPNRGLHEDKVRKLVRKHATDAGLAHVEGYKSHCFRRGGAQYRFMYAPLNERWTLSRIRWWGGWANSEQGDTLVKYLLDELFTYEEDHRDALQPNEDGFTTDLKGLEERKELRTAVSSDRPAPDQDVITAAVMQAVNAALANQPWRPCMMHSPSQNGPSWSPHPAPHFEPTHLPLGPWPMLTGNGTVPHAFQHDPSQRQHHFTPPYKPQPTPGAEGYNPHPNYPNPHAPPSRTQPHRVTIPNGGPATAPFYRHARTAHSPPYQHHSPLSSQTPTPQNQSFAVGRSTHGYHPYTFTPHRNHQPNNPPSWPPASLVHPNAPTRYAALPAHSRAAFVVAPQTIPPSTHMLEPHTHHWDSRSHGSSPPAPPATASPSALSMPSRASPHGHLSIPKVDRVTNPTALANSWRQVIDDWEGKDPRRCPVPLRDWEDSWHKKTPQAVVYHQRKIIAEEFINECHRDETLFLERYPAHKNGVGALVVAVTQARKQRMQTRGRASKNSENVAPCSS